MIVFFLLCTRLQTLWGKPLPPPLAPSAWATVNVTGVMAREGPATPDKGDQQLRTVYSVVQSCLVTISACVWTSLHPNINGPRDSWWLSMKRRVIVTLYTVIAPEMILLWALFQQTAAREIAKNYNKEFRTLEEKETTISSRFGQLFRRLPESSTRRGTRQPWTITHGFFVQMGGFILYEGEYPKQIIYYDRLAELLRAEAIDAPTVTERDLQDKSKGDAISKGIVVLQTTWFVLQCIARTAQRLPLSELEVLTLAFAVVNAATYAAWWSKPQGVDIGVRVQLKQVINEDSPYPPLAHSCQAYCQHNNSADNEPLSPPPIDHHSKEHVVKQDSPLRRMLQERGPDLSRPLARLLQNLLPHSIFQRAIHPWANSMAQHRIYRPEDLRASVFGFEYRVPTYVPEYVICIVGTIFGGIHLLGWTLEFPSLHDRILWHISAIVLTVTPFVILLAGGLPERGILKTIKNISLLPSFILGPFYILARFIVIGIAFKAIVHPPRDVLVDINWTRYIPHFWYN